MPEVIRDNLAHWVDDNVDALVRSFASDDDAVVVVADEGGVVDDGGGAQATTMVPTAHPGTIRKTLRATCPTRPALHCFKPARKSLGMALQYVRAFWGGGAPHVIRLLFYSLSQT